MRLMLSGILFAAWFCPAVLAQSEPPFIAGQGYSMVWHDEFDNLSLAPSYSNPGYRWWPGMWYDGPQVMQNFTCSNSILRIQTDPPITANSMTTVSHDLTQGKWWHYGYFEARMRFDANNPNSWAAFWTFSYDHAAGQNNEWSELDCFEAWGKGAFAGTAHDWVNQGGTLVNNQNLNNWQLLPGSPDLNQWHTYGMKWEPGKITWTFDNVEVMHASAWPINDHDRMFLILGAQSRTPMTTSSFLECDWVRVWQTGVTVAPVISSALTASGMVGQAFSYQITAANGPTTFNATGLPAGLSVNTGTGLISGTPTVAGTYSVTISATNSGGTGSATLTVTINPTPPPAPVLSSPANGAMGVSLSPTLAWNFASGATSYGLQVSTVSNFGTLIKNSSGLMSASASLSGLTNNTTYYWRVNAANGGGSGAWSLSWIFTTLSGSVAVTGVSVSPTSASITVGATQQLTATVSPANATNQAVSFSSSNSAIASVNGNGVVSGVAAGSATITVTTQDGNKTATSAITVTAIVPPAGGSITWGTPMNITGDADISTNGTLVYAYNWSGSNQTINGVTFTGTSSIGNAGNIVLAGGTGTVQLYQPFQQPATGLSSPYLAMLNNFPGVQSPGNSFTVTLQNLTVGNSYAVQLWSNISYYFGAQTETYTSGNTASLKPQVNNGGNSNYGQYVIGTFTANTTSQTITVNTSSGYGYPGAVLCGIQVRSMSGGGNVPVTGVSVNPTSATLNVGATQQLTATVSPANATNKSVSWSSSNTGIASVNASGLVTGVAAGSATITVTTQDGGKTASSAITITSTTVPVTGVSVSPSSATITAGATQQLTATVSPSNATNKNVSWSSSAIAVASVNSSGLVTGISAGSATITVTTQDGGKTASSAITVTASAPPPPGGSITWGAPMNISGDADVSTAGTLVYAYNWSGINQTINGVTFTGTSSIANVGGGSPYNIVLANGTGTVGLNQPYPQAATGLSAAYLALLNNFPAVSNPGASFTVTLQNLTVGKTYTVQVWANTSYYQGGQTVSFTSGNTVVLKKQVNNGGGTNYGQYAIGTFTASSTTLPITVNSSSSGGYPGAVLNAIQVRG
ncbi:MAG: Ig-like domain-containing protein [Chitinivibrionales bacterium]|nr:Ig-like domain-containing protein [Chitinivibrionales bacterium]